LQMVIALVGGVLGDLAGWRRGRIQQPG